MASKRPANERGGSGIEVPSEFLFAKLHGRRTSLYEGERLFALAEAGDVADLAYRLYPHAEIAEQSELELRIQNDCVEELVFVGRYAAGPQRDLYDALMHRYVVEDLKVLLRRFLQEEGAPPQQVGLIRLPRPYSLPAEDLSSSPNLEEFINRIPVRRLRTGIADALPLYGSTQRKAFLEMGLDRGCWQEVGAALLALSSEEREDCEAPVRCEFDTVRFTAVLRASRLYGLTWEQFQQVVPMGWGRLSPQAMRQLFEDPRLDVALDVLRTIAMDAWRLLSGRQEPDIAAMEQALWGETARLARHRFEASESGFGLLVSYFYLKQGETRRLLSLAQMVRRRRESDEIVAYLKG